MRDVATEFEELEVKVLALSTDDVAAMREFAKAQELNFQLLSDPDGSAAAKYGALMESRPYAKRHSPPPESNTDFYARGEGERRTKTPSHGRWRPALPPGTRSSEPQKGMERTYAPGDERSGLADGAVPTLLRVGAGSIFLAPQTAPQNRRHARG
ncbi:MAG: redoxin domain-containing protein [bacterium]|nr:redoxin domain-containing protein [bacterium]